MKTLVFALSFSALVIVSYATKQQPCYMSTHDRGVGKPLSVCQKGWVYDAGLCYPECEEGFTGVGPLCWQNCPEGWKDTGADCLKKSYGRGAGFTSEEKCEKHVSKHHQRILQADPFARFDNSTNTSSIDNSTNHTNATNSTNSTNQTNQTVPFVPVHNTSCQTWGALWYPDCAPGYKTAGCCVCNQICQANMTDIGVSCQKNTKTRGLGRFPGCDIDSQEQLGLCYKDCPKGYFGVGPVCWQDCPTGLEPCENGMCIVKGTCKGDLKNLKYDLESLTEDFIEMIQRNNTFWAFTKEVAKVASEMDGGMCPFPSTNTTTTQ